MKLLDKLLDHIANDASSSEDAKQERNASLPDEDLHYNLGQKIEEDRRPDQAQQDMNATDKAQSKKKERFRETKIILYKIRNKRADWEDIKQYLLHCLRYLVNWFSDFSNLYKFFTGVAATMLICLVGSLYSFKLGQPAPGFFVLLWTGLTKGFRLSLFLVLVLIVSAIILYYRWNIGKLSMDKRNLVASENQTMGSAEWIREQELLKKFEMGPPENATGIILGSAPLIGHQTAGNVISTREKMDYSIEINRNRVILGTPGTNKSRSIICNMIFQSIKKGYSIVVTDTKGDLFQKFYPLLRYMNESRKEALASGKAIDENDWRTYDYDIKALNFVNRSKSHSWNMLETITEEADCQMIAKSIIDNTSSGSSNDAYWRRGEEMILTAFIKSVALDERKRAAGMNNLSYILKKIRRSFFESPSAKTDRDAVFTDEFYQYFEDLPAGHPALGHYRIFINEKKNCAGMLSGLATRLQLIENSDLGALVSGSPYPDENVNTEAPARRRCIYFVTVPDTDNTMYFLSATFFTLLMANMTKYADKQPNNKCKYPVEIIMDEAAQLGRISGLGQKASSMRSREIRLTLAVQQIAQFQNRYPDNCEDGSWEEILGSCDMLICTGLSRTAVTSTNYMEKILGTMTVSTESSSKHLNTVRISNFTRNETVSDRETARALMNADEIAGIEQDELLVATRTASPMLLTKFDYERHPMFQYLDASLKRNRYIRNPDGSYLQDCNGQPVHDPFEGFEARWYEDYLAEKKAKDEEMHQWYLDNPIVSNTKSVQDSPVSAEPVSPPNAPSRTEDVGAEDFRTGSVPEKVPPVSAPTDPESLNSSMRCGRIEAAVDGYCEDDDEEAPADRAGQGVTPTEDAARTADIPEKFRAYIEASKKKKRLYANTKSFVDDEQAKTMDKFAIAREIVSRYAIVPGCTITAEEEKRYESFSRRVVALTVEMKSTGQSKEQYAQAIALSVLILEEYLITATDKSEQARRAHVLTQIQSSKIPDQNAYTILTKYRKMYYENKQKQ